MKKVREVKGWLNGYKEASDAYNDLAVLFDFAKEGEATEEEVDEQYNAAIQIVENLEFKNMLREEADPMSAVLKINAGAGGTEAQDWAQMLMRMYMRYAENHKYKLTISNLLEADDAGIKQVTMKIEGDYAYGYLKGENGVHRLVRVSPYNAQGKRMTSFASVFVTPLVDDTIEIVVEQSRPKREQGGVGCEVALPIQRPLHGRGRGNPHRKHRNSRPAQEPRECLAPPEVATL